MIRKNIQESDYIAKKASSIRSLMDLSIAKGHGTQPPSNKICLHDAFSTLRKAASESDVAQEKVATMLYVTYNCRIWRFARPAPCCMLIASPPALNGLSRVLTCWENPGTWSSASTRHRAISGS